MKPYGIAGIFCAFFMAMHVMQIRRDIDREKQRDARDIKMIEAFEAISKALNHLTKATIAEVTSRPHVQARTRDEMQRLNQEVSE